MFGDLGDKHLPHAPGHSGHDDPDFFAHDFLRKWISASIAVDPLLGKGRQTAYVPDMAKNRSHISEGPSQRQLRVGELIRRTLSDVLARGDIHDPDLNRYSITVGEVRTSPDLRVATAYVVPLGGKGQDDILELLNRNRGELRRAVSKNLTLKFSPELRFKLDDTFDRMDDTRRMFEQDNVRRDIES
jgi:ribosome-binding factor A